MSRVRNVIAAAVGASGLLCTIGTAAAQQRPSQPAQVSRIASIASGSIAGVVQDDKGAPISGAMISAVGVTTAFAVTDRLGQFELTALSPGAYLLRAHSAGYVASRGEMIQVHASARSSSTIQLQRAPASDKRQAQAAEPPAVLSAAVGGVLDAAPAPGDAAAKPDEGSSSTPDDDHGEVAWRLRHARRGILKDVTVPEDLLADKGIDNLRVLIGSVGPATANLLAGVPLSGQVNVLTTGSFDSPQQLFTGDSFSRNVTFVSLATPAGERSEWRMRGAVTSGDISSWFVTAAYTSHPAADGRHYDLGFTYSTQRYDGGNPAALRDVRDGSRNAGAVYADDSWSLSPNVSVNYGGAYARYDYLAGHGLFSPHVEVTLSPPGTFRLRGRAASEATAPGAQEFLPPDTGLWLPPQRTFSALSDAHPMDAERATTFTVEGEQDIASATVTIRAFRQRVDDQLATIFGLDTPDAPNAQIGHYFVGRTGDADVIGWGTTVRAQLMPRLHATAEYLSAHANWTSGPDAAYLMLVAPAAVPAPGDHVEHVSTALEAAVPETATRLLILYRVSRSNPSPGGDRPAAQSRFDLQLHQSLPFMDFSSARWEMLLAVRNFFHDPSADSSVYDELLVVHPPKRVVGGLTVKF